MRILRPVILAHMIGGGPSSSRAAVNTNTAAACIITPSTSRKRISSYWPTSLSARPIIRAGDVDIPILYEDDRLLAINKPPHVPHHDDPKSGQLGILSLIRQQQQQAQKSQSSPKPMFPYQGRLHGAHRLDCVTSGILLFAKDSGAASELMTAFREKEITKYYAAISGKKPRKKKQGWVRGEMAKGRRGSYKLANESRSKSNNYAETRFFTSGLGNLSLARRPSDERLDGADGSDEEGPIPKTAILFRPHTGKTHQLRVAAKSLGMPILGDERYGGGRPTRIPNTNSESEHGRNDGESEDGEWDRTYLHSCAVHFNLWDDDKAVTIWSPPPFGHLFSDGSELDDAFVGILAKHCDCAPILEAVGRST